MRNSRNCISSVEVELNYLDVNKTEISSIFRTSLNSGSVGVGFPSFGEKNTGFSLQLVRKSVKGHERDFRTKPRTARKPSSKFPSQLLASSVST